DNTYAQRNPRRMTLAELFEQEDREQRANALSKPMLAEIGEEGSEEEEDEAESSDVSSGAGASAERSQPTTSKQDYIPLAGYLLGRAVDSRPVPEGEIGRLRSAHDTVVQTRRHLRWGRGNVRQDNAATGNESLARSYMAQNLALDLAQKDSLTFENAPELAGAAMFSEAGTCREHAVVAMHLHANRLAGTTDTVHLASRPGVNHAWSELRAQSKRNRVIVMDPWAEGPAVFSEDARHTRLSIGVRSDGHYDAATAARASERAERAVQTLARETPAEAIDEFRSALAQTPLPKRALFDATPVVHRAFARKVEQKLAQPITATEALQAARRAGPLTKAIRSPLFTALRRNPSKTKSDAEAKFAAAQTGVRNEIKAIGIARSLGMANTVAEAVSDAKAIVDAARNLRRPERADTLPDETLPDTPQKQR
ncbi:hypothetical protein, partial [Trinickia sp.]|uniref:hypothetical protein n=1 Tax=Trinickia sp. TaxID=2571163 RepID=UPI003F80FDFA